MVEYNCKCCNYNTIDKSKYMRHVETNKHKTKEKKLGIREESLEDKIVELNRIINDLKNECLNKDKTIKRLNTFIDKNDKIDNKPRNFELINNAFCVGFIRTEKEIILERNNELHDILSLNIENIKKNIQFFEVYLKCLLENNTQPLTNFINSKFKASDYTTDEEGGIYFYNEKEEQVDIQSAFRILRRSIASQLRKSKELYFELLNKYRKHTEFEINIDFDLFDNVLTEGGKALTLQYFTDCLPPDA